jgi:putative addiction module component (TIGR02574 family)
MAAAMGLSPDDKVKLAEKLLESVEGADPKEIEELWLVEARRRLQELQEGTAHTIPAEDVFRSLDARLNRER